MEKSPSSKLISGRTTTTTVYSAGRIFHFVERIRSNDISICVIAILKCALPGFFMSRSAQLLKNIFLERNSTLSDLAGKADYEGI